MTTTRRRLLLVLLAALLLNGVLLLARPALAATYRQGSSGSEVKTIQQKLSRWGYYDGPVDGIFGTKTRKAVEYFQRKNGLTADGIVGPATLRALGMTASGGSLSTGSAAQEHDVNLLARVISAEARGEPYGRGDPQPHRAPLLPQYPGGSGVPAGGVHLHGGRADRPAGGRVRPPGRPGGAGGQRSLRRSHLLFQPQHRHLLLDLEPPPHQGHRQAPFLPVSTEKQRDFF